MGVELEIRDTGAAGVVQRIVDLAQSVTIGVHEDAAPYPDGTDVLEVAASLEFGSPTIPRYSFLRGYVDSTTGQRELGDAAEDQIAEVIDGADPKTVGEEIGDEGVVGILDYMDAGIRGEGHPGYTGNTAGDIRDLDETGHLRDQISAKIVRSR